MLSRQNSLVVLEHVQARDGLDPIDIQFVSPLEWSHEKEVRAFHRRREIVRLYRMA
jgi:hypothetical protein